MLGRIVDRRGDFDRIQELQYKLEQRDYEINRIKNFLMEKFKLTEEKDLFEQIQ